MLQAFYDLIGDFGNTWGDLVMLMCCMFIVLFTCICFLSFIASLFKR